MLTYLFFCWKLIMSFQIIINKLFNCIGIWKRLLIRLLFIPIILKLLCVWLSASILFFELLNHLVDFRRINQFIQDIIIFIYFLNIHKFFQFFCIWILSKLIFIFFHHLFYFISWNWNLSLFFLFKLVKSVS